MKVLITQGIFNQFILDLLNLINISIKRKEANDSYFKLIYEFMLRSNIISNRDLREILTNHFNQNYRKCYQLLINQKKENFYKELTYLLINLDFLEFYKLFFIYFQSDIDISNYMYSSSNFFLEKSGDYKSLFQMRKESWIASRENITKAFNIKINYSDDKLALLNDINLIQKEINEIYNKLTDFIKFEETKYNHYRSNNNTNCRDYFDFNHNLKLSFSNFFSSMKHLSDFSDIIILINQNDYDYNEEEENFLNNSDISYNINKNKLFKISDSVFISDVYKKSNLTDDNLNLKTFDFSTNFAEGGDALSNKLNEKLTSIEENLNSLNFEIDNHRNIKLQETKSFYSEKIESENEHKEYLLKLKIFEYLKKFYLYKKKNKNRKISIKQKENVSKIFYQNLLKSRSFFALLKWIKMIRNLMLINRTYNDYKNSILSKQLLTKFIYAYNRKNLCEAISELRDKRKKSKIFNFLKNKMKFKINHNKLYFSQLSNNPYSINFLLMICKIILTREKRHQNPLLKQKNYFNSNFKKLIILSDLNEKRKIFDSLKNSLLIIKYSKQILVNSNEKFSESLEKIRCREFFFNFKEKFKFNKKREKFLKKLFLVRFYFKKYKDEILGTKLKNLKFKLNEYRICLLKKVFLSFILKKINQRRIFRKFSKFTIRNKHLLLEIFQNLKYFSILRKKKNFLRQKFILNTRAKFLRNLKLVAIESLLRHGLNQKIQNFNKKNLLSILIHSSVNKYKQSQTKLNRLNRIKKLLLITLKESKLFRGKISKSLKQLFFRIFIQKVCMKKYLKYEIESQKMKKIEKFNKLLFFLYLRNKMKIFKKIKKFQNRKKIQIFKKFITLILKRKISKSLQNSRQSINQLDSFLMNDSNIKLFYKRLFLIKLFRFKIIKKITKNHCNKYFFKKFSKRINIKITITALKLFQRRMILIQNSKIFLNKVFKQIDRKTHLNELKNISLKFYTSNILSQMNLCVKNKIFTSQINTYHTLKIRKRSFNKIKIFYINQLKKKMLEERFLEYLKLKALDIMNGICISKYLKQNNNIFEN